MARRTKKPTAYLDTNVISMMFYRGGNVSALHRQLVTREWWDLERKGFRFWSSSQCELELSEGNYIGQKESVKFVRRLPYLSLTREVHRCAAILLDGGVIPEIASGDAVHLALVIVHEIDYLVTWNYSHLANADTTRRLGILSEKHDWRPPILVSPETMPRASLGQDIRRTD